MDNLRSSLSPKDQPEISSFPPPDSPRTLVGIASAARRNEIDNYGGTRMIQISWSPLLTCQIPARMVELHLLQQVQEQKAKRAELEATIEELKRGEIQKSKMHESALGLMQVFCCCLRNKYKKEVTELIRHNFAANANKPPRSNICPHVENQVFRRISGDLAPGNGASEQQGNQLTAFSAAKADRVRRAGNPSLAILYRIHLILVHRFPASRAPLLRSSKPRSKTRSASGRRPPPRRPRWRRS